MTAAKGLLLVTMEPAAVAEAEFNDWYDTEHIPERAAIPGFNTALRFVCLEGWPRYLALYDLDEVAVLHGPAYLAHAGNNVTPWSKRVLAGVRGLLRAECVQSYPGQAVTGSRGAAPRLVMWRFHAMPAGAAARLAPALRALYEQRPGTLQLRIFSSDHAGGAQFALVETADPAPLYGLDPGALGEAASYLGAINLYAPYYRNANRPGE